MTTTPPDIVEVLRAAGAVPDELALEDISRLLLDAAAVIETLRTLVGIADEVRGDEDAFQDNKPSERV